MALREGLTRPLVLVEEEFLGRRIDRVGGRRSGLRGLWVRCHGSRGSRGSCRRSHPWVARLLREAFEDPFLGESLWRGAQPRGEVLELLLGGAAESELVDLRLPEPAAGARGFEVALRGQGGEVTGQVGIVTGLLVGRRRGVALTRGGGGFRASAASE